jgi:hypothetical protein
MLRKLLKYEIKATSRTFIPVYIAILFVALVNRLVRITDSQVVMNLAGVVLAGLFIALGVLTIIGVVQRFKNNLLSDEGYLMFTLPVTTTKLITSKIVTTTIWSIASGIVAGLSFIILMVDENFIRNFDLIAEITNLIKNMQGSDLIIFIEVLLILLMSYIGFILIIYLSLATAQLPRFNKHRGAVSFVTFFVISTAIQWIGVIAVNVINPPYDDLTRVTMALIASIILNGILFYGTNYILKKHLNLE